MMKLRRLAGVFFGMFVLLFSSCGTPPPPPPPVVAPPPPPPPPPLPPIIETRMPLTVSLTNRLSSPERMAADIERFQLHIFGRVTLEREHTRSMDNVERGRATIVTEHIREIVIIHDQTPGQAIWVETIGGEIRIFVSFDDGDDFLVFSSRADNPDGFFDLRYDSGDMGSLSGDERGWLEFGGHNYRVRYIGDRTPHLLIQLSQEDRDRLNERTLRGRRVN